MKNSVLFLVAIPLLLIACGQGSGNQQRSVVATVEKPDLVTPEFNADSAYYFIEKQVSFGPRVPNTPEHIACAEYLAATLERFGADVIVQEAEVRAFDNTRLNIRNIIGQFQPEKSERLLLFAHWDTRPFADHDPDPAMRNTPILGANDGGSGVGVLLEIARHLQENPTHPGIDIIFFDAEDYGIPDHIHVPYRPDTWCLGSQYWGQNPHVRNYYARFGILLDMVGAKDAQFYREQHSLRFAPRLVDHIWNIAHELGYGAWFNFGIGGLITDDHVYVYKHLNIPSVNIIQHDPTSPTSFGSYWHTHADNMDIIDKATLKAVGQTVMEVIYREK
ncbi:M28 family peptidase [Natronoflexus pectinivorans]|uniref:Peptidase M28-like protein n=1 Tax=Natronoflexus pectinivorans TaxID=682526 RepID=A0A4R2GHL3_9BACT|nr:M28 family peptidase [Natronoflexus pectinivorans]TCO07918.1 peptidase M28-like protein [Natronoflexus pectinivorans]